MDSVIALVLRKYEHRQDSQVSSPHLLSPSRSHPPALGAGPSQARTSKSESAMASGGSLLSDAAVSQIPPCVRPRSIDLAGFAGHCPCNSSSTDPRTMAGFGHGSMLTAFLARKLVLVVVSPGSPRKHAWRPRTAGYETGQKQRALLVLSIVFQTFLETAVKR